MTSRTHDLAAVTALGLAAVVSAPPSLTLSTIFVAVLANQIGGIAPDIDQPTAPLWRNLPIGRLFGKVFDMLVGGHRFLSHSIVGVVLFGFVASLLLRVLQPVMPHVNGHVVWWAFMIGLLSHLVMDTLTKEGVPWLLPLPFKFGFPPVRRLRITTGKHVESLIVFPALLFCDVWLFASHYAILIDFLKHSLLA